VERLTTRRLRRLGDVLSDILLTQAVERVAAESALKPREVLAEARQIAAWLAWDRARRPPAPGMDIGEDTVHRLAERDGLDPNRLIP
jgi:hypothetical protein